MYPSVDLPGDLLYKALVLLSVQAAGSDEEALAV